MQFSDTTNLTGVVEDTHFLTQSNSTSYALKDIARNATRWAYKAIVRRIKANKRWEYDDSVNLGNHPIATATLVAGQQDYLLPTDLLKLSRIEVKDDSGDYRVLTPIDKTDITTGLTEFYETDGLPNFYDIIGSSIFLYPAPAAADVTTSEGLKIVYAREIDAFASTDTTQEPGLPEPFHRICSLGASYDYLLARGDKNVQSFRAELETLIEEYAEFDADKDESVKTRFRPAHNVRSYL